MRPPPNYKSDRVVALPAGNHGDISLPRVEIGERERNMLDRCTIQLGDTPLLVVIRDYSGAVVRIEAPTDPIINKDGMPLQPMCTVSSDKGSPKRLVSGLVTTPLFPAFKPLFVDRSDLPVSANTYLAKSGLAFEVRYVSEDGKQTPPITISASSNPTKFGVFKIEQ